MLLIDLNKEVFGKITAKEIIGAFPPAKPDTEKKLSSELDVLLTQIKNKSIQEIMVLITNQKENQAQVNGRPGAMALAQDKIKLFTEFSEKYLKELEKRLDVKC